MPKGNPIDLDESDFPKDVDPALRAEALSLIGISHEDKSKTLAEKLDIKYDNSAMLGDSKKKLTTAARLRTLFQQEKFSPLTRLIRLVKIEEAKLEAYNRAENYGLEPKLLDALPKPDKKFYASLLLQLAKYEAPELKAVEITGEVQAGMQVHIIHSTPQQKVIRVDANSPANLKAMFGQSTDKTLTLADKATAIALDDD